MTYRYVVYPVDKHQSQPYLTNDLPQYVADDDNEDTNDVIVDLVERQRWFRGEWAPVDTRGAPGEITQIYTKTMDSIRHQRDQANTNARNAYAARDECDQRHEADLRRIADLERALAAEQQRIARLEHQATDLRNNLEKAAAHVGIEGKNAASGFKTITSDEYLRYKQVEAFVRQLYADTQAFKAENGIE